MTQPDEPPSRYLHPVEPPYDPDYDEQPDPIQLAARAAEHALLGALLINPTRAAELLPALDPRDFASPAHEAIWNAAAHLHADQVIPDHPALLRHLHNDQIFQRAGGHELLLTLRPDTDPAIQPEHHASIVRDAAALRRLDTALAAARRAHRTADPTNIHATLEKLSDLADTAATTFGPPSNRPADTGLRDLSWILTGRPPTVDPPTYVQRTDGHALFYAGKVNGIFGDPEGGKTWVAQCAIVEALNTGGTAAMIDADHNGEDHTAVRLMLLGAHPEHIADPTRFRYYEPHEPHELTGAVADITTWAPNVYILDSLGEILPMLGINTNDGDEVTRAMRATCTGAAAAGTCVITIDHLPKSTEARTTGYAIGSIAKKRMMRGSYLRAEVRQQPTPGQIGRVTLRIEKDTAGELRKSSGGGYAGTFVLDSTQPHITTWAIDRETAPITADGTFRPTVLMEKASRFIEDNDQSTGRDIREHLQSKPKNVLAAVHCLINEGFVSVVEGPRNAKLHHSIAHYREAEDDDIQPTL